MMGIKGEKGEAGADGLTGAAGLPGVAGMVGEKENVVAEVVLEMIDWKLFYNIAITIIVNNKIPKYKNNLFCPSRWNYHFLLISTLTNTICNIIYN